MLERSENSEVPVGMLQLRCSVFAPNNGNEHERECSYAHPIRLFVSYMIIADFIALNKPIPRQTYFFDITDACSKCGYQT